MFHLIKVHSLRACKARRCPPDYVWVAELHHELHLIRHHLSSRRVMLDHLRQQQRTVRERAHTSAAVLLPSDGLQLTI
jgi:hypothetical protein